MARKSTLASILKTLVRRLYCTAPVNNLVAKVSSLFRRPPYRTNTMEFDYGLWAGISSAHDVHGRQLGEDNTWPKILRRQIPTEYHHSNLPGSRTGHRINLTTLHEVMRGWDDVWQLVVVMRERFVSVLPAGAQDRMPLIDMYLFSRVGVSLPAYLARRRIDRARDGQIPAPISNQFKVVTGISMIVRDIIQRGATLARATTMDAAEMYEYADQHDIFLSPGGQVCGGSKRRITELLDLVITGLPPSSEAVSPSVKRALAVLEPVETPLRYAFSSIQLELTLKLWRIELYRYLWGRSDGSVPTDDRTAAGLGLLRDHIRTELRTSQRVTTILDAGCDSLSLVLRRLGEAELDWGAVTSTSKDIRERITETSPEVTSMNSLYGQCGCLVDDLLRVCEQQQLSINGILGHYDDIQLSRATLDRKLNLFPQALANAHYAGA